MYVVFDLDGTLANIEHRRHLLDRKDWDGFFKACVDDLPNAPVIEAFAAHLNAGHRVEIWSARSDVVRRETEEWLALNGIDPWLLTHMRGTDDHRPDVELKRRWLCAIHPDERPDIIYDDRQRVVDMWRSEGIACFQVAADWEKPLIVAPTVSPLLTLMVGPSGGGKSTWAQRHRRADQIVSSDALRAEYCHGDFRDQSRNDEVFAALHRIAKARLDSGLPITIDATNLRRKDRLTCVSLAPENAGVRYVICNRPMADKVRDGGWRNDTLVGDKTLIETHEQRFNSGLADIMAGDDLPNVSVFDARIEELRAAA